MLCYCFGHTLEDIEKEVAATGTSCVPEAIAEKCRRGLNRCGENNPKGTCCLGDIRRAIKAAQDAVPSEASHACCADGKHGKLNMKEET